MSYDTAISSAIIINAMLNDVQFVADADHLLPNQQGMSPRDISRLPWKQAQKIIVMFRKLLLIIIISTVEKAAK